MLVEQIDAQAGAPIEPRLVHSVLLASHPTSQRCWRGGRSARERGHGMRAQSAAGRPCGIGRSGWSVREPAWLPVGLRGTGQGLGEAARRRLRAGFVWLLWAGRYLYAGPPCHKVALPGVPPAAGHPPPTGVDASYCPASQGVGTQALEGQVALGSAALGWPWTLLMRGRQAARRRALTGWRPSTNGLWAPVLGWTMLPHSCGL